MSENNLEVLQLKTPEDLKTYNYFLSSINSNAPFYKIGLVFNINTEVNQVNYFLFSLNGLPKIIMLFIVRTIEVSSQKTSYKDITSPYGYSGPLISEFTSDNEIGLFWNAVDHWYRKNNVITEFIRFSLNNNHLAYSGLVIPTLKNVRGQILDEASQWEKFDKKVRNNYRKAEQNNLTFKIYFKNITLKIVKEFYHLYNSTMIRRNAESQYFYPFSNFVEYATNNGDNCAIAMVYMDDVPISTEFILLSNDTVYSYLGGTNSNYFHTRPNDFLKVSILNWARNLGFKYYLLGGGRTNDDQLYAYKKSFFPKDNDVVFYTGRKVLNYDIYNELVSIVNNEFEIDENSKMDAMDSFFPAYRNPKLILPPR